MIAPQNKRCHFCLELRPITDFRRLYKDKETRAKECRACHNKHEAERQREKRSNRKLKDLDKFTRRLTQTLDHRKIALTCAQAFDYFHGVDGFTKELFRQYELAPLGSALRLNTLIAMMRIGEFVEANQPEPDDLELISDEDLERLQVEQLKRLIEAEPELAVAAAHRAGWTVRPNDPEADIQRALGNVP